MSGQCRKFAAVSSVITVSSNGRRNPLCLNSDIISSFTVIEDKNFDLDGIEMIRQYLKDYKLKARPLCADPIEAVSAMGTEFQKYVLGQKTEAEFFAGAQNCIDQYYKKASY